MKILVVMALLGLSACGWLGLRKAPPSPHPSQIIVTGAPKNCTIFVDGAPSGEPVTRNDQSEILDVTPGDHKVEIHLNNAIVYREDTYVGPGEHRVVTVLSGMNR